MDIWRYIYALRRQWALATIVLVACVGGAAAATLLKTPLYRTTTRLIVSGGSNISAIDELSRRQLAQERATAFAQIASTPPAIRAAAQAAGAAPGGVSVTALAPAETPFVDITVSGKDRHQVQAIANGYLNSLPAVVAGLDQVASGAQAQLSRLQPAPLPSKPYTPRPIRNLVLGLAAGLVLGYGAAIFRDSLNAVFRTGDEIEDTLRVPVLGTVPLANEQDPLPALNDPSSTRTEAYRQVVTNLQFATPEGPPGSFLVTSAIAGEGKTTVASNLAALAAGGGASVVLVDADLRRPMIDRVFGVEPSPGLADLLAGNAQLDETLVDLPGSSLSLLPAGRPPAHPAELLGSARAEALLRQLTSEFDVVIVDTAPLLPVTDARLLSKDVDGVVLVTRLSATGRTLVQRAITALAKVDARVFGITANGARAADDTAYGYYSYTYRRYGRPSEGGGPSREGPRKPKSPAPTARPRRRAERSDSATSADQP